MSGAQTLLEEAQSILLSGCVFSLESQQYLANALALHLVTGESLDVLLGLRITNDCGIQARHRVLIKQRNQAIASLFAALCGDATKSAGIEALRCFINARSRSMAAPVNPNEHLAAEIINTSLALRRDLPRDRRLRQIITEQEG